MTSRPRSSWLLSNCEVCGPPWRCMNLSSSSVIGPSCHRWPVGAQRIDSTAGTACYCKLVSPMLPRDATGQHLACWGFLVISICARRRGAVGKHVQFHWPSTASRPPSDPCRRRMGALQAHHTLARRNETSMHTGFGPSIRKIS